jgi:hypothetical protein
MMAGECETLGMTLPDFEKALRVQRIPAGFSKT